MSANKWLIVFTVIALAVAAYLGYSLSSARAEREIEQLKNEQAMKVIAAQNEARTVYENDIKKLSADLKRVRDDHANRLRELEQFRSRNGDMETCRRDRADLASLAVRGEELLKRADAYLGALVQ